MDVAAVGRAQRTDATHRPPPPPSLLYRPPPRATYRGLGARHRRVELLRVAHQHEAGAVEAGNGQQGVGLCHLAALVKDHNGKALPVEAGKGGRSARDAHNAGGGELRRAVAALVDFVNRLQHGDALLFCQLRLEHGTELPQLRLVGVGGAVRRIGQDGLCNLAGAAHATKLLKAEVEQALQDPIHGDVGC